MGLKTRLHRMEKLGRLHAPKRQPATVEHTASGEYYVLSADARTHIGDEAAFQKWQAEGNRCAVVIAGLTATGSELVQRIIGGEGTERKDQR